MASPHRRCPVPPFQIVWLSAFRHRWARRYSTLDPTPTPTPPPLGDICVQTRQHCTQMPQLMWSTSHLRRADSFSNQQITFFQAVLCSWTAPGSWQP